jgi:hypothetical protein
MGHLRLIRRTLRLPEQHQGAFQLIGEIPLIPVTAMVIPNKFSSEFRSRT